MTSLIPWALEYSYLQCAQCYSYFKHYCRGTEHSTEDSSVSSPRDKRERVLYWVPSPQRLVRLKAYAETLCSIPCREQNGFYFKGNWRHLRIHGPLVERDSRGLFHMTSIWFNMIVKMKPRVYQSLSALNSDNSIGFHYSDTAFMRCIWTQTWSDQLLSPFRYRFRQQALFEVLDNVDTTHVYHATTYQWSDCAARCLTRYSAEVFPTM